MNPAIPWQHRELISILAWQEIAGRYRGSFLGGVWPLLTPLIMLAVYTMVFGVVVPMRWPGGEGGGMGHVALRLLSGMLVHGLLSEVLARAPTLVTSQPNYVKKVVFPLDTLAWVSLLTALFHVGLALLVLLLINGVLGGGFAWAQLALPLILLPFALLLVGIVWLLAGFGVYVRDLHQMVGPFVIVLMFLGPVFYPRDALPEAIRPWVALNPITVPIEQFRLVLFSGLWPDWGALAQYSAAAIGVYLLGWLTFNALKKGFADVL